MGHVFNQEQDATLQVNYIAWDWRIFSYMVMHIIVVQLKKANISVHGLHYKSHVMLFKKHSR